MVRRFAPSLLLLTVAVSVIVSPRNALAQTRWASIDSARVSRLVAHVLPLDKPAEIESWVSSFEEVSILALGEPTHGDGSAFELRSALTTGLHQRGGFRRLALEALGAFDPPDSVSAGAARLWSGSADAWPGLEYALASTGPDRLELLGMDVQHRYHAPWWERTAAELTESGLMNATWPEVEGTLRAGFSNPFDPVDPGQQARVRDAVRGFEEALLQHDHSESARFLSNALANVATAWEQRYEPRNRQMAANLTALAAGGSRVIVWAATAHMARTLQAVDTMTEDWSYDDSHTVGEHLAAAMGDSYRVVAFTACGGSYGASHIGLSQADIKPLAEGSLEALVCALPFETAAYVDLRAARASADLGWLQVPLLAGPLGYEAKLASWPTALDGLIVMRSMRPSRPRQSE